MRLARERARARSRAAPFPRLHLSLDSFLSTFLLGRIAGAGGRSTQKRKHRQLLPRSCHSDGLNRGNLCGRGHGQGICPVLKVVKMYKKKKNERKQSKSAIKNKNSKIAKLSEK